MSKMGGIRPARRGPNGATFLKLLRRLEEATTLNIDEQRLKAALEANADVCARVDGKRLNWHWKPAELRKIDRFIARRARIGNGKPFRRNDEVRRLAEELGRSEWSVYRMIERRRKARKCSNATPGQEA